MSISHNFSNNNTLDAIVVPTPLMCVEVATIVPPYHQALLRCAGSAGVDVYEEVVARGKAPLYIENTSTSLIDDDAVIRHAPTTLPIPDDTIDTPPFDLNRAVLVVTHDYLVQQDVQLAAVKVQPFIRVRYICMENASNPGRNKYWQGAGFNKLLSVEVCEVNTVRAIHNNFMWNGVSLVNVDLSPFHSLTSVGDMFLYVCSSLTSIDLTPLRNITTLGTYFMAGCAALTSIDLTPLSNITTINHNFMVSCTSLTAIDLTPLVNVTSVGRDFMSQCKSLAAIDLSPFKNVTSIDMTFLGFCESLTSIDLTPLGNLTKVGKYFMCECTSLEEANVGKVGVLAGFDQTFMSDCTALRK